MNREPNTVYVLSLSYGKDSIAAIEACKRIGYPIDRIVHAEVWATDDIPADLPPMVEFKSVADKIIKERYGLTVDHVCATTTPDKKFGGGCADVSNSKAKLTYADIFYRPLKSKKAKKSVGGVQRYGFPMHCGQWCNSMLKMAALRAGRTALRGVEERDGATNSSIRFPDISKRELVYQPQTKGFPRRPRTTGEK